MNKVKIKSHLFTLLIFILAVTQQNILYSQSENVVPKSAQALSELGKNFTFMIASDLGRNGYYDQKPVAEMMGEVAAIADVEFVAEIGDVHHFLGVKSVQDPLWQTNFEWIYKHPGLMIRWYPILGNHEYRGNTQAVIDYSNVSRRWIMPARYYAKTFTVSKNIEVLLLFIDTVPMIDKYRNDPDEYPDAGKQSMDRQLAWIDSTLSASKAKWKIVLGHHPLYAETGKEESERADLKKRLQPLLDKHKVDISVAGHIHNFQHMHVTNSDVDYFVNSSASLTRKVSHLDGHLFISADSGFSLCTVKDTELIISFVNKAGEIIYQYKRTK